MQHYLTFESFDSPQTKLMNDPCKHTTIKYVFDIFSGVQIRIVDVWMFRDCSETRGNPPTL